MNLGQILIDVAAIAAAGAAVLFIRDGRAGASPNPSAALSGEKLYLVMLGALVAAAATMFTLLLDHQYGYTYVAHYSSNSLPLLYTISAFWAGQEGTFLFWALLAAVMGYVFLRTTADRLAMAAVSAFTAFLALLMIVKSPFETSAAVPHDGSGLNPLLQDPWMAIHPPILFAGYAAAVFPFALACSALARRNFDNWRTAGFAWSLFASVALGAGIIIGGFWAYEVLGWGGYWGWDPVENSSLVPWLVLLALLHGLLVEKTRGGLARTNIVLAIVSFLLVLYATFLTRSGVLADFSVHSFVDLGINNYLIGAMALAVVVGLGLFVTRFRAIPAGKLELAGINRELALVLGTGALLAAALFTCAGMSSPLITGIFGKASQVDTSFYNRVNLPVAIVIALLLGVTPFLGWSGEQKAGLLKRLSMPLLLTVLAAVISRVAGVTSPMMILFTASSAFALVSNAVVTGRQYRSGWMSLGGPLAHIGVALLLIGIVGSGSFDETKQLLLRTGEPQEAFGYRFTFKGVTEPQAVKPLMNIEVTDGKSTFLALPKLYFSEYNQSLLREPDIRILPLKDLYISPLELHAGEVQRPTLELTKGELKNYGGYAFTFTGFETGQHEGAAAMTVGAVLKINTGAGPDQAVTPTLTFSERGRESSPVDLPLLHMPSKGAEHPKVALNAVSVEQQKVLLEFVDFGPASAPPPDELHVEVSTKPLMMVVWTGVVLIIAGTAIAWRRRLAPG